MKSPSNAREERDYEILINKPTFSYKFCYIEYAEEVHMSFISYASYLKIF